MSSGTLATAASDRKSRLAALKNLKRKQTEPDDDDLPPPKSPKLDSQSTPSPPSPTTTTPDPTITHLSGRNYDPLTRGPRLGFEAPPSALALTTLETAAAALSAETLALTAKDAEDEKLDLFKLQPKKPNWDLRRDLERKLATLGVRTENAIARLVRERIRGEKAERERRVGAKAGNGAGEETEVGMDGAMFVEATREREREDEEDLRRERELDQELLDGS